MVNTLITFLLSLIFWITLLPSPTVLAQSSSCVLPEWFFATANYNNQHVAIGISDNKMEKEEAFEQAKINALLNYSILHKAKFSSLTTSGIGNQQNGSYSNTSLEYVVISAVIKGQIFIPEEFEVIDSFYTENKEAIVLIKMDKLVDSGRVYSYNIYRRAGFQKENSNHPFFADELDVLITSGDSIVYTSEIIKDGNQISNQKVKASMNMFEFLTDIQFFKPYQNYQQTDQRSLPSPLNFGLWNSYLFNLVDQICIYNSFKTDFHHKLSSNNTGNVNDKTTQKSIQEYIYSLKNIQAREIKTKLKNIAIEENQLFCYFSPTGENYDFKQNTISMLSKRDKKELKKLKKENWQLIGNQNVKNAWFEAKNRVSSSPDHLVAGVDIWSSNLSSGILEAIQLAKLELSSLLGAKVAALTLNDQKNNKQTFTNSSKLSNIIKTRRIEPFYLFYRKNNKNAWQVKAILFYPMN
jgi:hypothetical protein